MERRLFCLLLVLALLLGNLPAVSAADSGTWGGNVTWRFDAATGTLTISGSGKMMYEYVAPDWLSHDGEIRSVIVGEGITDLCDYAFYCCRSLTSVSLPASLRTIGGNAFQSCESLRSIRLPAGLQYIGGMAFGGCVALSAIELPQGLRSIGGEAFWQCESLTAIDIPGSVEALGGRFLAGCKALKQVTLHPGLKVVGKEAFRGLWATSLVLPATVTEIGESAFEGCGLERITLNEGLKSIGYRAFCDCANLKSITLPSSLEYVGDSAFEFTPLKTVIVRCPNCNFAHSASAIYGVFGVGGAVVYGDPGCRAQQLIEMFPDNGYTFRPLYFDDVAPGVWYYDDVVFAKEHGLFQGVGTRAFAPESAMSRGMVVQVLYNFAGNGAVCANPFADVPDSAWYARAVCWAAQEGIVNGVGQGRFAAEASVTRQQLAAIMFRFTRWQGIEAAGGGDLNAFPDRAAVGDWAVEAMGWAVQNGILTGSAVNGVNYLRPDATATRAQVAAIMRRCVGLWDSRTHTDLCIGVAFPGAGYPTVLQEPFEQAAADYMARHGDVRIRFTLSEIMSYDETLRYADGEDAVVLMGDAFRTRFQAPGTAVTELQTTPFVFMARQGNPADPWTLETVMDRLKAGEIDLGMPTRTSPVRTYTVQLLKEYGITDMSKIEWTPEEGLYEGAWEMIAGLVSCAPGTEFISRVEGLPMLPDSKRGGQGEPLCAYYPENSAKREALEDFFAELRGGSFDSIFSAYGLYPVE